VAFALPAAFLACLSILAGRMLLPTSRTSNKQQHADMRIVPTYFRPSCASLQLPLQVAVEREVVRYMSGDSSIRQQAAAALLPRCSSFAAVAVAAWLCCVSLLLLLQQPHGCPSSPQQHFLILTSASCLCAIPAMQLVCRTGTVPAPQCQVTLPDRPICAHLPLCLDHVPGRSVVEYGGGGGGCAAYPRRCWQRPFCCLPPLLPKAFFR
jgi:hypothetical protein